MKTNRAHAADQLFCDIPPRQPALSRIRRNLEGCGLRGWCLHGYVDIIALAQNRSSSNCEIARKMVIEHELNSTNGLERLSTVFRSVDWMVPAYMSVGGISSIAAMLEHEPMSKREEILEWVLPGLYDEERLASMLLGLYNQAIYVRDFKVQITEFIEAWHSGLHHAAVATIIPVLEGIVRKIAKEGDRNIGGGTKKLIDELDELIAKEDRSPHRYGERIVMLTGLRDFFAERLLKHTDDYDGLDQLNRHGILHGIFEAYGAAVNFLRLITLLDLLCFAMVLAHGGSSFAPDWDPIGFRPIVLTSRDRQN